MKTLHIVSAALIALAVLVLTPNGAFAENVASESNNFKIVIEADGKDCATKGGALITNEDGSKTCTIRCRRVAN